VLGELVDFAYGRAATSFARLRAAKHREMRAKRPALQSHYIYTACRDAVTEVESFLAMKGEPGLHRRPAVNRQRSFCMSGELRSALLLYAAYRLEYERAVMGSEPGVSLEDLESVLREIPKKKYGGQIYADAGDIVADLRQLIEEGYVTTKGGRYRVTEAGGIAAWRVKRSNVGYFGYLKDIVEKSIRLYLADERLLAATRGI